MTGRVIAGEKQGQSWTDYRGPFATLLALSNLWTSAENRDLTHALTPPI
jgi:hypothetical protein